MATFDERDTPGLFHKKPTFELFAKVVETVREFDLTPLAKYKDCSFSIRLKGDIHGRYEVLYSKRKLSVKLTASIKPLSKGPYSPLIYNQVPGPDENSPPGLDIRMEDWNTGLRVVAVDCMLYEGHLLNVLDLLKLEFGQK